jgi:hypothetical protein
MSFKAKPFKRSERGGCAVFRREKDTEPAAVLHDPNAL